MNRIKGIDTLRFICAFTVILGHFGLPEFHGAGAKYINGFMNNVFVGIAAVMVFFIISGFCIHYPYTNDRKINVVTFYFQRFFRIAIPAFIAFILYKVLFNEGLGVLWSLICEIIYYFLYPFILELKQKYKLTYLIIISFVISLSVSLVTDLFSVNYNGDFHRNGFLITWIVGLPMWLLGVKLADDYAKVSNQAIIGFWRLNLIRVLILSFAWVASVARFHLNVSYVYTLPFFSIFAYFWLQKELDYYRNREENKLLEFGGRISYSIYLVHMILPFILQTHYVGVTLRNNPILWGISIPLSLLIAVLYFYTVEKPSHKFAKLINFQPKNAVS